MAEFLRLCRSCYARCFWKWLCILNKNTGFFLCLESPVLHWGHRPLPLRQTIETIFSGGHKAEDLLNGGIPGVVTLFRLFKSLSQSTSKLGDLKQPSFYGIYDFVGWAILCSTPHQQRSLSGIQLTGQSGGFTHVSGIMARWAGRLVSAGTGQQSI